MVGVVGSSPIVPTNTKRLNSSQALSSTKMEAFVASIFFCFFKFRGSLCSAILIINIFARIYLLKLNAASN